jgi:hypothetical protein
LRQGGVTGTTDSEIFRLIIENISLEVERIRPTDAVARSLQTQFDSGKVAMLPFIRSKIFGPETVIAGRQEFSTRLPIKIKPAALFCFFIDSDRILTNDQVSKNSQKMTNLYTKNSKVLFESSFYPNTTGAGYETSFATWDNKNIEEIYQAFQRAVGFDKSNGNSNGVDIETFFRVRY